MKKRQQLPKPGLTYYCGWQGVFLNISKGIKWFEYRLTICREVVKYYLTDLVRKGGPQISEN